MALWTLLLGFCAEVLNFLEFMAALGAAIGIQRQGSFLSGKTSTTVSIVPGIGGAGRPRLLAFAVAAGPLPFQMFKRVLIQFAFSLP
jgi:EamA domain-containing membrane protein RarD